MKNFDSIIVIYVTFQVVCMQLCTIELNDNLGLDL